MGKSDRVDSELNALKLITKAMQILIKDGDALKYEALVIEQEVLDHDNFSIRVKCNAPEIVQSILKIPVKESFIRIEQCIDLKSSDWVGCELEGNKLILIGDEQLRQQQLRYMYENIRNSLYSPA